MIANGIRTTSALCMGAMFFCMLALPARAADARVGPELKDFQQVLDRAIAFLKKQQRKDGSFSPRVAGPGISALVVAGLVRNGVSAEEPMVAKTLAYMKSQVKDDGGIYDRFLANYTTSVALMGFQEANKNGRFNSIIQKASKFLKGLQDDSGDENVKHGGVGYDGKKRPDLSNTQFFVDALLAAGVPKDDPAIKRALKFISRCQNLKGEHNDQPFAKKASKDDEGGFTYTPLDPDDSPHKTSGGGLRSLGGMTYGGLKSFLYAGVKKSDPRVKAALRWIKRHYTLEENPGMGQGGLYYYYHTFGKAMAALGDNYLVDAKGKKHDWRAELFDALRKRQSSDGSWSNAKDKTFGEKNADLSTAFAVLTLSYCRNVAK